MWSLGEIPPSNTYIYIYILRSRCGKGTTNRKHTIIIIILLIINMLKRSDICQVIIPLGKIPNHPQRRKQYMKTKWHRLAFRFDVFTWENSSILQIFDVVLSVICDATALKWWHRNATKAIMCFRDVCVEYSQIARFMRPTWGPPGADRVVLEYSR